MNLKYNTKQRNKTVQGLRSFKDTLPTKVKRILIKKITNIKNDKIKNSLLELSRLFKTK